MRTIVAPLIEKWEKRMQVNVNDFRIKRMKPKWGSCNIEEGRIWLNLELIKKPVGCLEYIIVHEMNHLNERNHNHRFIALMDQFMPKWRLIRAELNELPIGHVDSFSLDYKAN